MMNRRGQSLMLALLFTFMFFLLGITFVNFFPDEVTAARSALSCSDAANISDGTKITCLIVDLVIPYLIIMVVSIAAGIALERLLT